MDGAELRVYIQVMLLVCCSKGTVTVSAMQHRSFKACMHAMAACVTPTVSRDHY